MFEKNKIKNPLQPEVSKILNPFAAPKKAVLTIEVDLQTQRSTLTSTIQLHPLIQVDILLQIAVGIIKYLQQAESMIVGKGSAPFLNPNADLVENLEKKYEKENTAPGGKDAEKNDH